MQGRNPPCHDDSEHGEEKPRQGGAPVRNAHSGRREPDSADCERCRQKPGVLLVVAPDFVFVGPVARARDDRRSERHRVPEEWHRVGQQRTQSDGVAEAAAKRGGPRECVEKRKDRWRGEQRPDEQRRADRDRHSQGTEAQPKVGSGDGVQRRADDQGERSLEVSPRELRRLDRGEAHGVAQEALRAAARSHAFDETEHPGKEYEGVRIRMLAPGEDLRREEEGNGNHQARRSTQTQTSPVEPRTGPENGQLEQQHEREARCRRKDARREHDGRERRALAVPKERHTASKEGVPEGHRPLSKSFAHDQRPGQLLKGRV